MVVCRPSVPAWASAVVVALLAIASGSAPPVRAGGRLACEETGHCSLDAVSPSSGDVRDLAALQRVLKSCSYNKELIITAVTDDYVASALQMHDHLRGLGFGHMAVVVNTKHGCDLLFELTDRVAHIRPPCCLWYNITLPQPRIVPDAFRGMGEILHKKHRAVAKIARLGYNVLALDNDLMIFHNPYKYFKSPLYGMQDKTLIVQRDGNTGPNSGCYYVQNARPDGPAVWIVADVVDRQLRFGEDYSAVEKWVGRGELLPFLWDQACLNEAMVSAAVGRHYWKDVVLLGDKLTPERFSQAVQAYQTMFSSYDGAAVPGRVKVPMPPGWVTLLDWDVEPVVMRARIPNCKGVWPDELGGLLYAPRRQYSQDWQDELREVPAPMWPDPEDGSQEAAAAAIQESIMFAPAWLASQWSMRGMLGAWDGHLTGNVPQQVIAHIVCVGGDYNLGKHVVKLGTRAWNWSLAREMHPEFEPIIAARMLPPRSPPPRLLAYHPALLDMLQVAHNADLAHVFRLLHQAAAVLGRAIVWPAIRCDSPGIPREWNAAKKSVTYPFSVNNNFYIFAAPSDEHGGRTMCMTNELVRPECLAHGAGVTHMEWDYLRQWYPARYPAPSGDNTLISGTAPLRELLPSLLASAMPQRRADHTQPVAQDHGVKALLDVDTLTVSWPGSQQAGAVNGDSSQQSTVVSIANVTVQDLMEEVSERGLDEQADILYVSLPFHVDASGVKDPFLHSRVLEGEHLRSACPAFSPEALSFLAENPELYKDQLRRRRMRQHGLQRAGSLGA